MSLQVWLPLNGNLNNQGLSNVVVTNYGATVNNNGKIGKCYSLDGTDDRINISNLPNPQNISVAFWMKRNSTTNSRQFMFTAWGGVTCELTASNTIHCYVNGGNGACDTSNAITPNTGWFHLVYTFEDGVGGKLYIDGQLVKSTASSGSISWTTTSGNIGNYSNMYYDGCMNDFRFYDHVLSPKEVEEISKGLVLHYKLDRMPAKNILTTDTTRTATIASGGTNVYTSYWYLDTSIVPYIQEGTILTVEYDYEVDMSTITADTSYIYSQFNTSIISPSNNLTYAQMSANPSGRKIDTFKVTAAQAALSTFRIRIRLNSSNEGGKFTISNIRMYFGTPDEFNIIHDVSGYENNAISVGAIVTNNDTIRHSLSTKMANGQYIRTEGRPASILPTDAITVNLWMKHSSWANPISCTEGGGWNFENSSGIQFPLYVSGTGYKIANSGITPATLANEWHMLTGTFDKTTVKIYIDGELKKSTDTGTTAGIGYANNYLFIGAEASGDSTSPASSGYTGLLSDIRIYCTALSENQIKELYDTSTSVDSLGNIYSREVIEI